MQRGRYHFVVLAGALTLAGWSSRSAFAAAPTATGLPTGFNAATLGDSTSDAQSVTVDANGAWTIKAGGSGLTTEADGGIGVYQPHSGNGSIIAHVTSLSAPATQIAVAFRTATDQGAQVLRLKFSGDSSQVGFTGLSGKGSDSIPAAGRPLGSGMWIGMDRTDNKFGFYFSNDGKVWSQIAKAVDSQSVYPADMQVGIEASGGSATVDSVSVSNDLLAPRAVTGVSYLPRDKSAIVSWTPAVVTGSDVTYNVYSFKTANASDTPQKVNKEPITTSSYLVENLTNGTDYRFGVTAEVGGVESPMVLPEPTTNGGIGLVTPNAPIGNGLQLYTVGTATPGSLTVTGDGAAAVYSMKVGGWDFWEGGDGFSMLAMPMEGNLDVSLRLLEGPTDNGDGWAQGGPTFRETLDPGSRMAMAIISAANTMQFKRRLVYNQRPTNSDASQGGGDNTARPEWSRIVRKGDTFTAYFADGAATPKDSDWQPMGDPNTDTIPGFAKTPYVGMAWTAHKEGAVADVKVDNFTIKAAPTGSSPNHCSAMAAVTARWAAPP